MIKLLEIANSVDQQQVDEGFKEKALATAAVAAGMAYGGYKKYVPQDIPQKPETVQTTQATQKPEASVEVQFRKSVESIINNIEGAYVDPTKLKNPLERNIFRKSGETMFGIDRKTGGKINNTPAGKKFWQLIDLNKRKNPSKWVRYYDGGEIKDELKDLATQMMEPRFKRLFNTHLDDKSQQIVKSDPRLFFHFVYATWNGDGWFKKFARKFNERVNKGITDPDKLFNEVIKDRVNGGGVLKRKADKVAQAAKSFY